MFRSARFKIAIWFVLAIVFISLLFSFVFYRAVARDLNARYAGIELKIKNNIRNLERIPPVLKTLLRNDLRVAKQRIIFIILFANGGIFFLSLLIGYFIAGRALKPIEEMVEEQNRFISDASHELRTPLSVIKTATEVALRDKELSTNDARRILEDNLKDLENLETLTERLLRLSQYQKDLKVLKFEIFDLGQIAKDIYRKIIPVAQKKMIDLKLEADSAYIRGDKISIEELILVLLDNAIKYTPEKGIVTLSVANVGRFAVIKVADSGAGINRKDLPHIFDRFYRAEESRSKQKEPGFGLGLSVAKKIAGIHNGTISAISSTGKGSTFKVVLPCVK